MKEVGHLHELAVGIELELAGGAVADPYRLRIPVAGEVRQLDLRKQTLAGDPIHDLQILGVTCPRGRMGERLEDQRGSVDFARMLSVVAAALVAHVLAEVAV